MLRHSLILLLTWALSAFNPADALDKTRSISQFHHTAWATEDGVPADIWAIAQTPDGYLWLGSVNGLYRFDGVRVERVAANLLPSPSIHALAATPSGGLWIGYERPIGMISLFQNGTVQNFKIDAPSSTSIHNIVLGPNGSVWAATPDVILRFDGAEWRAMQSDWGTSLGEASGGVWAFGVARDGVVWSRNQNGLFFLQPGFRKFSKAEGYVGGVASFTTTPDGRLWTTDSVAGHLYALPDLQHVEGRIPPAPTPGILVSESLRGAIMLDRDSTLWFTSSSGGGLRRIRDGPANEQRIDRFTAADGLSSDVVHTVFEDREGNIWVGTNLGLDRFRPANVVTETRIPAGFRARFVQSTHGAIYAYTGWSNTANRTTDASESLYRILPGRDPELLVANVGRLRTMLVDDRSGAIWLLTTQGLRRLEGKKLLPPLSLPHGVEGESVYSAAIDEHGVFWISAFRYGVFRQDNGNWRKVALRPRGATGVLTADPDGGVWVRYAGGALLKVVGEEIRDYSDIVPPIGDLTFIKADSHGLLIGGEAGLARFDGRQFHHLTASSLPALSVMTGLDETPDGNTWVFTQGGILRFATDELESALMHSRSAQPRFEVIGPRDGLPGAPYGGVYGNTVAKGPDGRVWFTTGQGLVWIDPKNLYHNPLPPPVVVRSLAANGVTYDSPSDLRLKAGTGNIQVDYAALSLTIPERNHFRYRLDGVDQDWVDAGDRRQAFYTKLGPGNYRFHVTASNNDGVWSETGATFSFVIPPTFLQSAPFLIICFLGVTAALWLLYSLRVRQVAAHLRGRLEERVTERERIARELHDTLLQGFQGLTLRFQSVADQIPDPRVRKLMDSALERADEVLVEGRDRVRNLRPPKKPAGLVETLTAAAEQMAWNSNATFKAGYEGKVRPLHPLVLVELSAIGKEAIVNAFKHSQAANIVVTVSFGRWDLRLSIRDDGVGISAADLAGAGKDEHFGLTGMRERAAKIRAALAILTPPEGGTHVQVTVPGNLAYAAGHRAATLHEQL